MPMLSARNIQGRRLLFDEFRWISEPDFVLEHKRTRIAPDDVLLTIVGTIGRTAVVPNNTQLFALQRSVAVLTPRSAVLAQYLSHSLESPSIQRCLQENAKGTAQKGIYLGVLGEVEIPLAPLPEQKRIADKLDALLARVDACRERLDRVPKILKRFRQSVLAAATSGELTREWREARGLEMKWPNILLYEICHSIADGDHQAPPKSATGVPFITIGAINTGVLRLENATRFVPAEYFNSLKPERRARLGDVLFSVTGSIGISALVDTDLPFVFQRHIAVLRPNLKIMGAKFLSYRLSAEDIQLQCAAVATGTAQLTIPLGGLRSFAFSLPSIPEQEEIVRRVDSLFTMASALEKRCQNATAFITSLTPSTLAKAFRGELVPQDPNDEPASELLARIRSQVAVSGSAMPKRGKA